MGNSVPLDTKKKKIKRDYAVTFFPEGGNLLAGQYQRIAFKVQGADGYSEQAEGKIMDSKGNILANFSTLHDGMGSFFLDVPDDEKLKAIVVAKRDNLQREFILPEIMKQGIALAVTVQSRKFAYKILGYSDTSLSLIIHSRGRLLEIINLEEGKTIGEVSTISYPDGIIQLLLCDNAGKALSRRLVFVRNKGNENG